MLLFAYLSHTEQTLPHTLPHVTCQSSHVIDNNEAQGQHNRLVLSLGHRQVLPAAKVYGMQQTVTKLFTARTGGSKHDFIRIVDLKTWLLTQVQPTQERGHGRVLLLINCLFIIFCTVYSKSFKQTVYSSTRPFPLSCVCCTFTHNHVVRPSCRFFYSAADFSPLKNPPDKQERRLAPDSAIISGSGSLQPVNICGRKQERNYFPQDGSLNVVHALLFGYSTLLVHTKICILHIFLQHKSEQSFPYQKNVGKGRTGTKIAKNEMHKMNSDKHPIQYEKTGAKKAKPANNIKIKH